MRSRLPALVLMVLSSICFVRVSAAATQAQAAPAATPAAAPVAAAQAPAPTVPAASPETPAPAVAGQTEPATPGGTAQAESGASTKELTTGQAFLLKLRQGGTTMIFLFLASVAGVAYAIERFVNLRARSFVPSGMAEQADELWHEGKFDEIEAMADRSNSTLARVLAVIARHRHSSMADISIMAGDVASRDLRRHLQKAYPLAIVATVSPLLGLFGTVIGMIGAFDKVSAAGSLGDASLLGGDIAKALITTAAGLSIAIPALVCYHYFKNRTSQFALQIEEEVGELISEWFAAPVDSQPAPVEVSANEG